jgi:hypothetical protein
VLSRRLILRVYIRFAQNLDINRDLRLDTTVINISWCLIISRRKTSARFPAIIILRTEI